MEFLLAKKGQWYIPAYDEDLELSKKIAQGQIVRAKTERKRNYELHKKCFKVISIGFENQSKYENIEHYREVLLIAVGHCDIIYLETGQANFKAKSISYDAMPDDYEFGILYNKIVEKVAQWLDITNSDLAEQVISQF